MSKRTPSDIIRSDERNTYVMSCHLNRDELYKAMREDISTMCYAYSIIKAQRDELQKHLKEEHWGKARCLLNDYGRTGLCPVCAAIANAEKPPCA